MKPTPSPMGLIFEKVASHFISEVLKNPEETMLAFDIFEDWLGRHNAPDAHEIVHAAIEAHKYGNISTKQCRAVINQFIKDPRIKSAMNKAMDADTDS